MDILDYHINKAKEAGDIKDDVTFEEMKRFVEEKNYSIDFHPQENLRAEFHAFDKLLPILGERTWTVLVAPDNGPEFICSDHPVTLVWKNRNNGPIGYELRETEIFFPLGRRVAFLGVFEDPFPPEVKITSIQVAKMNRRVSLNAERHVFSALESYLMWHEGEIHKVSCKAK